MPMNDARSDLLAAIRRGQLAVLAGVGNRGITGLCPFHTRPCFLLLYRDPAEEGSGAA